MYIIRPPPMSTRLAKDSARDVVASEAQAQAANTHEKAATAATSAAIGWRPRTVGDVFGRVVMTHSLTNRAWLRVLHASSRNMQSGPTSALGQKQTSAHV